LNGIKFLGRNNIFSPIQLTVANNFHLDFGLNKDDELIVSDAKSHFFEKR
jgi:chromosome segregation and condensation protein ScpB